MKFHNDWLMLVAILACSVSIYGYPLALPTPLLDPDEGLHASIAQEMVENGDYVVPRLQGAPFLDKPILYFAAQAHSLKMFGMNEAAVRLPGFLFALLGVATTALLAGRMFDRLTGLVAALVALTLVVPLALAQAAAHDIALVPWTNLLLLCWWEADRSGSLRKRLLLTVSASGLVALALLTKGLIGIAIVSVGYSMFVLLSRQITVPLAARFISTLSVGSALASPWFMAMEQSAPGYLWYYFVERHFSGFVSEAQQHGGEPWHYYLPILIGGTMPWILYLGPGLWQSWLDQRQSQHKREISAVLFALCWLVGGLLFLSVAGSKLITYALPLFPAIAILAGYSFKRYFEYELSEKVDIVFTRMFQFVCIIGCIAPVATLLVTDYFLQVDSSAPAYLLALLAGAVMLAAIFLVRRGRRYASVAVGSMWFALFFIFMMTWPLQRVAQQYSQKSLGIQLADLLELPEQVLLVDGGKRIASVIFYLTKEQRRSLQSGQIVTATSANFDQGCIFPADTILAITDSALGESQNPLVKKLAETEVSQGSWRLVRLPMSFAGRSEKQTW
ncbi:MAG: glycosyltransferase family 39 protein [Pirellulales bacterium]